MLIDLYIKNYAIIEEATLSFDEQLNVLTGETGAGKSIILGALSLILGARVERSALINHTEKCIIEAKFNLQNLKKIQALFELYDLDYEDITIIRREINTNNKSRAFINDTPVTLSVLQNITEHLVDLHGQFDTSSLKDRNFIYEVVDAMANHENLLEKYIHQFKEQRTLAAKIKTLENTLIKAAQDQDYHQFLLDELLEAQLKEGEEEEISHQLKQIEYQEDIQELQYKVQQYFQEERGGIIALLNEAYDDVERLEKIQFEKYTELAQRFKSALIEMEDIAEELIRLEEEPELDASIIEQLEEKQNTLFHLFKKHQVNSSAELIHIKEDLEIKLQNSEQATEELTSLKIKFKDSEQAALKLAQQLSQSRAKAIEKFLPKVNDMIHLIGMPNAQLNIAHQVQAEMSESGIDLLHFEWDANKSGFYQPLDKIASGGELSRIMLCIKTLTAQAMQLPTLIFDEVDTGISGEAARQVSLLLEDLSQEHQIICITHLSQVASKGKHHFYVYKAEENGKVNTHIKVLNRQERIEHIAEMISGGVITEAIISHVAEMIQQ